MKKLWLFVFAASLAATPPLFGQSASEVESLRQQLKTMEQEFLRVQREQAQKIESLTRKLDELSRTQNTQTEREKLEKELATDLAKPNAAPDSGKGVTPPAEASPAWSAAQPLPIVSTRSGSAYMNISFDALLDAGWSTERLPWEDLQLGDHDPNKRGFTLPNAEIALDGAVDPYFKGFANLLFKLDHDNETSVEMEEAYLQSSSLPANLQVKAGQFLAAFGRQNSQHPHSWSFADQPIALTRAFGPEGLRNPGGQVSWLVPTPFYTELFLGVLDGRGSTAYNFRNSGETVGGVDRLRGRETLDRQIRGFGDLLYVPRLASSFDLTDQQTVVIGTSAALGPNDTGAERRTEIYGVDLYWKWKPARAQAGFPFVSWQTEGLWQNFEAGADPGAGLPRENLRDWGFYSQILWGFRPRWVAGFRGEYADGNSALNDPLDPLRGRRHRLSPDLTFYPSEFSKIRLQYNYDRGDRFGTEHSVWFQVEFLLGAHGAHQF